MEHPTLSHFIRAGTANTKNAGFFVLAISASIAATSAAASDAGNAWGTTSSSSGNAFFMQSAATHANNGTAAVYSEKGRDAQLPGTSITTIGVFNQLSVIGDSNSLTTDQTGDNSGAVTSDTDLTYHETFVPIPQTLFEQP